MIAVKPVGATWSSQRSLSMARIREAATCWVCTSVPVNDEPLVGLSTISAPSCDALAHPVAEEDLPRDGDAEPAGRGVEPGRPLADDGVALGQVPAAERLEQPPQRHVLAERHPVHLVVAVDDLAVGVVGDRVVGEVLGPGVLDDAGDQRRVERRGPARPARGPPRDVSSSSTSTTSSGHTTRSTGVSTSSLASRWRSNTSRSSVFHARVPCGPAALHERDPQLTAGRGARGPTAAADHGEHDDGAATPAASQRRATSAASATPAITVTSTSSSDAAEAQHRRQRSGHLAHGQARQRDAAERPRPAQQLGQGDGAGQGQPAAGRGGGHDGDGQAEQGGVGDRGDDVARAPSCRSSRPATARTGPGRPAAPRRNRAQRGRSAISRSRHGEPTNASGHQPHGGRAAASSTPVPRQETAVRAVRRAWQRR